MTICYICPRCCAADRALTLGVCLAKDGPVVSKIMLHQWEEPFLTGAFGSGTIFFSGCSLRCVYCQNREISQGIKGRTLSQDELLHWMFRLKKLGASNINLVTASHFTPALVPILREARALGLDLPIVWNSSAYESVKTLASLDGLVDIYLPDFKYMDPALARRYSLAGDYPETAKRAVAEMVRQTGPLVFDGDVLVRGTVVRHLILPGHTQDSEDILAYLYTAYGDTIFFSIMNQYTPPPGLDKFPHLARRLTAAEYDEVVDFALSVGIEQALIQGPESQSVEFKPDFDRFFEEVL